MAFDVIIAGAGPAGQSCASRLASEGFNVLLIERKPKTGYPVCCGEAVSEKSLKSSGFYDDSFISARVKGYRIFFPDNNFMTVNSPGFILDRGAFEQFLEKNAREKGADIHLNETVISVFQDNSHVFVKTNRGEYKASYFIAADGPDSLCAKMLFKEEQPKYINAMQFRIKKISSGIKSCEGWLDFYYDTISPYYFWNFEKQDHFNTGGACKNPDELKSFISRRLTSVLYETIDFTRGKIPVSGLKKKIVSARSALIGDAAGAVNPVSFAGIYGALLSSRLCAEAAVNALRKNNPLKLLDYQNKMHKTNFASPFTLYVSKHSFSFSQKTLNSLGAYFKGRNYRTKDLVSFLKIIIGNTSLIKDLASLAAHRIILRTQADKMW